MQPIHSNPHIALELFHYCHSNPSVSILYFHFPVSDKTVYHHRNYTPGHVPILSYTVFHWPLVSGLFSHTF